MKYYRANFAVGGPGSFVRNTKQEMFYYLRKIKPNTLIDSYFFLSNTNYMAWLPGAVAVKFRNGPQRHCFFNSVFFNTLYTSYTEVTIKQSFLHEY